MKVLIGCEFTGIVRDAFRVAGHDAWSCDIDPTEADPKWHYQCNVLDVLKPKPLFDTPWDLAIFHPPCTYLSNSGVQWLYEPDSAERWKSLISASMFFKQLLRSPIEKIAIENPVMNPYAKQIIEQEQDQIIEPWQFGHGEQKQTCLWLKNLPPLKPTNIVEGREQKVFAMGPKTGVDRGKERSRFYTGIAKAMADQWG